jgi:polysaccharide deacetylase 2 family uncharacterized protein YibQ
MSVLKLFLGFLVGLIACAILLGLISIRSPILADVDKLATRKVAQSSAVEEKNSEQSGNIQEDPASDATNSSDQTIQTETAKTDEVAAVEQSDEEPASPSAEVQEATVVEPTKPETMGVPEVAEQNTNELPKADEATTEVMRKAEPEDTAPKVAEPEVAAVQEPEAQVPEVSEPEVQVPETPAPARPQVVELKKEGNTLALGAGSSRLPKISDGTSGSRLKLDSETEQDAPTTAIPTQEITVFSQNSEEIGDLESPLISIILLDVGATGVTQSALLQQTLPFTFGIDGSRSDAGRVSSDYRDAGFEVVSVLSDTAVDALSSGAEGVALVQNALNNMPDALAVVDGPAAMLQKNKQVFGPVLSALQESGHGILSYKIGLNSAFKEAQKAGIPSGSVFRSIDPEASDASEVQRIMDRVAFEATREGAAIVFAVATETVLQGISDWTGTPVAGTVSLVPVSSAMTKLSR